LILPEGATLIASLDSDLQEQHFVITHVDFQAVGIDAANGGLVKQQVPIYERTKKSEVIDAEIIDVK
jgi:hypothetical protein